MTEPMPTANSPQRTQGTQRLAVADINRVSAVIIDCSMTVHTHLGPGLLESAYHACLLHELRSRGLRVDSHVSLPIVYKDVSIDVGYRLDLVVEDEIIVELKSVERVHPVHEAQLLSYLKLSKRRLGLLINFNVLHLKDGITRLVNGL
jgi:GxxExxY protein